MERDSRIEFRLRIGNYEIEIKGSIEEIEALLEKSLEYIPRIKSEGGDKRFLKKVEEASKLEEVIPPVEITGKESVTTILSKLFSTKWASKPRTLKEVTEALESLGLHYPKSTIAVSLARLVKRNVIRRIKRENIYVYVPVKPPVGETIE